MRATVFFILVCLIYSPVWAKDVAMVTSVVGQVEVSQGGEWSKAMVLKTLPSRTRFRVHQGTLQLALFSDGSRWTVKGPAQGEVTEAGPRILEGSHSQLSRQDTRKMAGGKAVAPVSVSMGGGLVRDGAPPSLLRPLCLGSLRSTQPEFRWRGADQYTTYKVELLDVVDTSLWSTVVKATRASFPGQVEPLERGGIYYLVVSALKAGTQEEETSARVEFQILSAEGLKEVEALEAVLDRKELSDATILASHYLSKELYDDALKIGLEMKRMNSEDPGISLYLAEVYEQLGLVEDSEEFSRLAQRQGAD